MKSSNPAWLVLVVWISVQLNERRYIFCVMSTTRKSFYCWHFWGKTVFFFFLRKNIFFSPSWTNGRRRNFSCWSSLSHFEQITKWNRKKRRRERKERENVETDKQYEKCWQLHRIFLIEGWIGSCKLKNFLPVFFQNRKITNHFF